MTSRQQSRREILKAGAVLAASASFPAKIRFAAAQSKAGAAHSSAQIDAVLRRAVDTKDVPGVVAVAATDKGILYEGAFGTRDLAKGPDMTLDTLFRLASMTKAVTSVAAMQLVAQGKLQLDQPVGNVLPELAAQQSRLVSVHQRKPDGSLEPTTATDPPWREFWSGGGGLFSTGRDYLVFLQMLMHQGSCNGARLLRPETVAVM